MKKTSTVLSLKKDELELLLSNPKWCKKHYSLTEEEYSARVNELQQFIEHSKRGKYSRNKGGTYERTIAKAFKSKLHIELTRTPQSGGFKKVLSGVTFKGDLTNLSDDLDFRLHIECKNQKNIAIRKFVNQAEEDCPAGKIPVVIYHKSEIIKDGKRQEECGDYICMRLSDFFDTVDRDKIIEKRRKRS